MIRETVVVAFKAIAKGMRTYDLVKMKTHSVTRELRQMNFVLHQSLGAWKKNIAPMQGVVGWGGRVGSRIREMTHGFRGFRMEMLGVMFFGMGMVHLFSRMLRPAAELYSMFEIWGQTLQIVFLPIMTLLFPIFMSFVEVLINMGEPVQMLIGTFTVLGLVVGMIIMLIGMLALGIGSIILVGVSTIVTAIGIVGAVVGTLTLIIVGIVMIMKDKFEGIGLIIMGIGIILLLFISWWALIPIAVGIAVYLIIKYWGKIVDFFKSSWEFIKKIFKSSWNWIKQMFFKYHLVGIIIKNWTKIKTFFSTIWEGIKNIFSGAWLKIKGTVKGMVTGIASIFTNSAVSIKTAILSIFPKWARNMIWNFGKFTISIFTKKSGGGDSKGGSEKGLNDFIWRPGQSPIRINPNDTLVGTKSGMGTGGGGITINQVLNVTTSNRDEIDRAIRENNMRLVDDVKRLTGA